MASFSAGKLFERDADSEAYAEPYAYQSSISQHSPGADDRLKQSIWYAKGVRSFRSPFSPTSFPRPPFPKAPPPTPNRSAEQPDLSSPPTNHKSPPDSDPIPHRQREPTSHAQTSNASIGTTVPPNVPVMCYAAQLPAAASAIAESSSTWNE